MRNRAPFPAICLTIVLWFAHCACGAEAPASPDAGFGVLPPQRESHVSSLRGGLLAETWTEPVFFQGRTWPGDGRFPFRHSRLATRMTVSSAKYGAVFGYVGVPGEPAFGTPLYEHALIDDEVRAGGAHEHWLDPAGVSDRTVTAGYAWRGMRLEGSAFRSHSDGAERNEPVKPFGLTSGRLSFSSRGNWTLQASRRRSTRLDEIEGADPMRRTTVSATYRRASDAAEWKTTFAAGRASPSEGKSPGKALLCESVLTLRHAHTLFARWERAAAADIFNQDERLRGKDFKAEKLTFGYVYDLVLGPRSRLDMGLINSRGASLSPRDDILDENRRSYKVFARLTLPY